MIPINCTVYIQRLHGELSRIVFADNEGILNFIRVLSENSLPSLCDLRLIHEKTRNLNVGDLMVDPEPATLALGVELILVTLLIHNQVDKITHLGAWSNIESHSLCRVVGDEMRKKTDNHNALGTAWLDNAGDTVGWCDINADCTLIADADVKAPMVASLWQSAVGNCVDP